jgi:pyridoxamine 5'-phosphate oxidase
LTDDPFATFDAWFPDEAAGRAAAVATATADGRPSVRMVLVKDADADGFVFFTNYESRKGDELAANPRAALLFHREGRQVRVEGSVERVGAADSDAYWAQRPPGSRRSAAASAQSREIQSREALEAAVAAQPDDPPRPAHWGGYRVVPETIELWEHRDDRLHDRHLFRRCAGGWESVRLQP